MTEPQSTDDTELDRPAPVSTPENVLDGFQETPIFDALRTGWTDFYAQHAARNGSSNGTPVGSQDAPTDPVTAGGDPVTAGGDPVTAGGHPGAEVVA